jgi:hypothetical protein
VRGVKWRWNIFGLAGVRSWELIMKALKVVVMMAMVLGAGALAAESAFAGGRGGFHGGGHFHGGHSGFHKSRVVVGIGVGVPVYWGPWYYPPAYYYPPSYYYPPYYAYPPAYSAPTYIERGDAPAEQPSQWWYYCADSKAYYPYVKECPGGWQRVAPQPPPPR